MKTLLATLILSASLSTTVFASGNPGKHFMDNWDANDDGSVTLAEVSERRSDIFATFDENDDGFIDKAEYKHFNDTRAEHQKDKKAENKGKKKGKGLGRGNGGGGEYGKRGQKGMQFSFNDVNKDGKVSKDEFVSQSTAWFKIMDRNDDKAITTADFGPRG
ncbi:MAG: EF-hand domain-containing protein [Rhizobiaceae bacterium]